MNPAPVFAPQPSPLKLFSIVIPARDEEAALPPTLRNLHATLLREGVPHELVVVDDGSTDRTWAVLQELRREIPSLNPVQNPGRMASAGPVSAASTTCAATPAPW